ncbi:hypothetical protein JRO89_XS08G0181400 [Xanthoceras sorbifolium]|uniref:GAG-pre-integrase domain-containing protein n=1 Tax=Xanthoceras sorbifolium TaxID=99658 RepID=A0ABQ8HQA9_9ROSI|nr:hypothetical protein JRO89_XS08G0181400 [Xanthoceras sorbifolium]
MAVDNEAPPPPPLKIEPNSPFYLGPQDRPGDFITPTRLRDDNYDDWSSDVRTALEARRKFEFLDGTITTPTPPCTQSDWNAIHAMLVSWITNTISLELHTSIAKCEQTKNMSVSTYFAKLNKLWEELHNHEPLIECSCCFSCTAGVQHESRRETGMLHQFLMGLYSEYYTQTRANILSHDPLPSLNRAYQLLIQDERVRLAKATPEDTLPNTALGFVLRTDTGWERGRVDRPDRSHLVCTHCKKTGHEVTHCFELHGYPEWYDDRMKTNGGGRGRGRNSGRGRSSARANTTVTIPVVGAADTVAGGTAGSSSQQVFSADQWKALAGFFGNVKIPENRLNGTFNAQLWIVDTGANHHVTGDMSWLINKKTISDYLVGLPNGKTVNATQEGSDQSRELIGTGVRRDGLYYFGGTDSVQHVSVKGDSSNLELWHRRMGHPSEKVVKLLPPAKGDKFASRSRKCLFVRYPFGKKGWKLFNLDTKEFVELNEDVDLDFLDVQAFDNMENIDGQPTVQVQQDQAAQQAHSTQPAVAPTELGHVAPAAGLGPSVEIPHVPMSSLGDNESSDMGRGFHKKFPSVLLRDFVNHNVFVTSPSPATSTPQHSSAITSSKEPRSFKEAMKDVSWKMSMHEEIQALEDNGMWTKMVNVLWEANGCIEINLTLMAF